MQLIIAEKPSVTHLIAAVVGATDRKDSYLADAGFVCRGALGISWR